MNKQIETPKSFEKKMNEMFLEQNLENSSNYFFSKI